MATSLFDAMYKTFAVPSLMAYNGDVQAITYDDGRTHVSVRGVIQDRQILEREVSDGTRLKVETCVVILSNDPMEGVANPQICATLEFDGIKWVIDLEGESPGIEAITGNLTRLRVKKLSAIAKAYPDQYKRV
jgi:hypothetical protein